MNFINTSIIRRFTLFLVAMMLSICTMAADFNQIQRLANQGDVSAQILLGSMYYEGKGVRQDYAKSIEWYTKVANQGNSNAQAFLGAAYSGGKGVRQDYAKSIEWYTKAANQGNAGAQYNLALMYFQGKGVRQDFRISKEWVGKSCDNGYQYGCDMYREMNELGF